MERSRTYLSGKGPLDHRSCGFGEAVHGRRKHYVGSERDAVVIGRHNPNLGVSFLRSIDDPEHRRVGGRHDDIRASRDQGLGGGLGNGGIGPRVDVLLAESDVRVHAARTEVESLGLAGQRGKLEPVDTADLPSFSNQCGDYAGEKVGIVLIDVDPTQIVRCRSQHFLRRVMGRKTYLGVGEVRRHLECRIHHGAVGED